MSQICKLDVPSSETLISAMLLLMHVDTLTCRKSRPAKQNGCERCKMPCITIA